ncbi:LAME_0G16864g1_1 [Lachancea meyersii CBS 8951]|uniref:LAME_0G16864g1_1 n=1 Tax=Lachancea meyersii CBS 8951 TaxID=1266667 RepID=A0A1G4KBA2_9SACH|nr:LAME_0G16864g1_1 [Lachancea meyersii CBS 8951]
MPLKHLPIQPSIVSIAPSPHPGSTREGRKPGGHGLVIRTSRQWVLPPRPKPGRKPCLSALSGRHAASGDAGKPVKPQQTTQHTTQQTNQHSQPSQQRTSASVIPEKQSAPRKTTAAATAAAVAPVAAAGDERSMKLEKDHIAAAPSPTETITATPSVVEAPVSASASASAAASIAVTATKNFPVSAPQESSSAVAPVPEVSVSLQQMVPEDKAVFRRTSSSAPSVAPTTVKTTTNPVQPLSSATCAPTLKKLTKTALKKEIQHLKLENFKLKQEMGHLVGSLQDLKQKFSLFNNASSAVAPTSLHLSSTKKRPFLDSMEQKTCSDNTDSFLKFEDDNAEDEDASNAIISSAHMRPTMSFSSQYSSRTTLTDDEDPGFSSSTPSSLFSAELQRSVTNSSHVSSQPYHHHLQSLQNSSGTPSYSPLHHGSSSPSSMISTKATLSSLNSIKFVDDYEHQDFYSKHRQMFDNGIAPNLPSNSIVSPSTSNQPGDFHLDAIKEEDMDFRLEHDFGNEDVSILNFLENHSSRFDNTTATTAVTNTIPRWLVKDEEALGSDMDGFQSYSTEPELPKQEFRMPPSLEELIGEENSVRSEIEIKREDDEDDDLSRMNIFDFA